MSTTAGKIYKAGLIAAFCMASHLHGVIITSLSGANGADAYITKGGAMFNYGSADCLNTGGTDNAWIRNAYLRFDLSTAGFDLADTEFVSLKITAAIPEDIRPDDIIGLFGIPDGATGDGPTCWSESTLTYQNAPVVIDGSNNSNPLATAIIPSANISIAGEPRFAFEAGYSFVFQSTDLLDFLKADTNGLVTLLIQYTSVNLDFMFPMAFSENANAASHPSLSITDVNSVPEPSTCSLFASIGAIFFLWRHRRQENRLD